MGKLTAIIELAVGLGCLVGVPAVLRSGRRWVAPLLAVAGLAAVAHGVIALVTG